jgi:hypothetical protein
VCVCVYVCTLQIAGLPPNPEHDGKSLLPMLQSKQGTTNRLALEAGWKTSQLIAYLSVGTYYNDHAELWISGPAAEPGTPVTYASGPYAPAALNESKANCIQVRRCAEGEEMRRVQPKCNQVANKCS